MREAAEAAVAAGCTDLGVWSHHVPLLGDPAAAGVRVVALEGATAWAGRDAAKAAREAAGLAEQAAALGSRLVLAYCPWTELADGNRARAALAALAERAAEAGATTCVEFIPGTGVPTLAAAWDLVAPLDGVGIVLDTWHWSRRRGGPDLEVLSRLPGDRVPYVQLADAGAADLTPDTRPTPVVSTGGLSERQLPGAGVVDIATVLGALDGIGCEPFVAAEVFNAELVRMRGTKGAAQAMADACRSVLATAMPRPTRPL